MARIESKDIIAQDIYANAIKSAEDMLKVQDKLNKEFIETATLQKEQVKNIEATARGVKKLEAIERESLKTEKEQQQVLLATAKVEKELANVKAANARATAAEIRLQEQQKKIREKNLRGLKKEEGAYAKLSKQLNENRKRLKDLIVSEKGAGKEAIALQKKVASMDKTLKAADASAGQFQRNVGNYPKTFSKVGSAFQGLTRIVGQFGVALGGVAIARDAFNVIKDFDQAQANLAAITGKSREEISGLTKQAKELGSTTTFTATEVAGLQTELAKLGFETTEIDQSTESVLLFAKATGADLSEAAALTGSTLRAFGLDASESGRVASVLGVATTKTALDFGKLNTAMATIAPVANSFGFSVEETTALLGQLSNAGFDASSSATATRNIILNLADSNGDLAKALGRPIKSTADLAAGFNELEAQGIDLAEALELTDKRSVAAFQTFRNQADGLQPLVESLTDVEEELNKIAETQDDTLQGSISRLRSAWEGYILGVDGSSGASERLKEIIQFLADNLEVILDTIIRLARAFVVFKTVLFLTNKVIVPLGSVILKMGKGMIGLAKGTKTATTAFKGMNSAMKANIIAFVAIAVIELVDALDLFTSEADRAADRLEKRFAKIDELRKDATDETGRGLKKGNDEFRDSLELLELSLQKEKKLATTQKERNRLDAEFQKERQKLFTTEDNRRRTTVQGFINIKKGNDLEIKSNKFLINQNEKIIESGKTDLEDVEKRVIVIKKLHKENKELEDFNIKIGTTLKLRRKNLDDFGREQLKQTVDDITQRKIRGKSTAKELTALEKLQKELKKLEKQRENLVSRDGDINDPETWKKTNTEIEKTKDKIQDILIVLGRLNAQEAIGVDEFLKGVDEKYQEAEEIRKDAARKRFDNLVQENEDELKFIELGLLKEGKSRKEISDIILEEEIRLLEERIQIFKENGEEVIDLELDLARKQQAIEDKKRKEQIDSYKQIIDSVKGLLETLTNIISKQIDKQIAKFTEQVDASKERQTEFKQLALNGNEDAKKSLQQEEANEAQALSKKAQAEKRKAQLEKTSIILESIGNLVGQGLSIPEATAQSITAFQLVETALKGLDSFLVGTEDTGKNGSLDSNGGRLAILHDNERVMTKDQNKMIGGMSNWELATMAGQYQAGELNTQTLDVQKTQLNVFDTTKLESEIKDLKKVVADKPVQNWRVEQVTDDIKEYVETIHKNGKLTNNRFRRWVK